MFSQIDLIIVGFFAFSFGFICGIICAKPSVREAFLEGVSLSILWKNK